MLNSQVQEWPFNWDCATLGHWSSANCKRFQSSVLILLDLSAALTLLTIRSSCPCSHHWTSLGLHFAGLNPISLVGLSGTTAMLFWLDVYQTQSNLYKWFRMQRHDWSSTSPNFLQRAFIFLHWLPVAARIKFKTLMLAYRTTTGSAPALLPLTITNLHLLQKPRLLPLTITNLSPPEAPAYFHSL